MAWQTEPAMMQKPANRKEMLMIRRATEPMADISAEASKKLSSSSGASWKMARPTAMMPTAEQTASFTVFFTRSIRMAPKL